MTRLTLVLALVFLFKHASVQGADAPILDIEDVITGYVGQISERNVLVDLKPHLAIKNSDSINGICSYHVFKPNNEEFPFNIDIKDKSTGEAVIEVQKNKESAAASSDANRKNYLDCNKTKEYEFLIQAHDCSTPSLASERIPVKIVVLDHDDSRLAFQQASYVKSVVESELMYENFMEVKARDQDCTNNGYACSYSLLSSLLDDVDDSFAFKIDNTGRISSTRALKRGESFEFVVRAFDCVNKDSYTDVNVKISVIEKCKSEWTDYPSEFIGNTENNRPFSTMNFKKCDQEYQSAYASQDAVCKVESVKSKVTLELDPALKATCQPEKCVATANANKVSDSVVTLFPTDGPQALKSAVADSDEDDDNIEDDVDDDSGEPATASTKRDLNPPVSYTSFSKTSENAKKINFDGSFGDKFVLNAWIRRPADADQTIKEQVFCGSDSKAMNRHHYGLYFYRGNLKFLLRKEGNNNNKKTSPGDNDASEVNEIDGSSVEVAGSSTETFYPSLWEWTIYEPILSDSKWHNYEIRFNYPNASLYIDGVKFSENTSNSDIIDAYKLNEGIDTGDVITYVGACYHARKQKPIDHFEGDIGSITITKTSDEVVKTDCKSSCNEYLDMSVSKEDQSIESASMFEISLSASNLDEMSQILKRIDYVSKEATPKPGSRSIKLSTKLKCGNNKEELMKDVLINLKAEKAKQYVIRLEGDKQIVASQSDLDSGIQPFKDIQIVKKEVGESTENDLESTPDRVADEESNEDNIDSQSAESDTLPNDNSSGLSSVKLSKCQVAIKPNRNLMVPESNNEKIMFLQNLLDQYGFNFEETLGQVTVSGEADLASYQTFLRRLTYVVIGINDVDQEKLKLISSKKFFISCVRADTNQETNTIQIQLSLTKKAVETVHSESYTALKQVNRYVVNDEDDVVQLKSKEFTGNAGSTADASSPLKVAMVVMASCGIGFMLVFSMVRLFNRRSSGKKPLPNEENPPQMEWDDSGLTITENPFESMESGKNSRGSGGGQPKLSFDSDEGSDEDENEFDGGDYYDEDEDDEDIEDEEEELGGRFYRSASIDENGVGGGDDSASIRGVVNRGELEWDDTSLDVKLKQHNRPKSNKTTSSFISPNHFV